MITEQSLREGRRGAVLRPFRDHAGVTTRGCSQPLQRKIADFGAERSGRSTVAALAEHYSIEIPLYQVDSVTRKTAKEAHKFNLNLPQGENTPEILVVEVDGSMVPIVDFKEVEESSSREEAQDKRKRRTCQWNEIRVCSAHDPTRADAYYGVYFGEALGTGLMMDITCRQFGMDKDTFIHGVGDGAPWIADQYEKQFGSQHYFLLDFFHLCEYLADASGACADTQQPVAKKKWMDRQKQRLKSGRHEEVIGAMIPFKEDEDTASTDAPVRNALRYMNNRLEQFDYQTAIDADLPIGSGEIESAHRHLIQRRLKLPGAWWLQETAADMAQLRVTRSNNLWDIFWQQKAA